METGPSDDNASESGSNSDRPNRWAGPPSTWRHMNRDEINTVTALDELRNSDLSTHLYNAFALKQRHSRLNGDGAPVPEEDINAATGQKVQADDWMPQRSWTAWPMSAKTVPPDEFMKRTEDGDERFTTKRPGAEMPSQALEEAVSAAMLRFAREKFESRPWEELDLVDEEIEDEDDELSEDASITSGITRSWSRSMSRSVNPESGIEGDEIGVRDRMDVDDSASDSEDGESPPRERFLQPAASADDELSYSLLRPSARHILSKLDATLTVLHNSRKATMTYASDSSSESEIQKSPVKRRRGRPAKAGLSRRLREASARFSQDDGQDVLSKKKTGRPRKVYQRLEGETDREFAIRIARQRREPITFFPDTDPENEAQSAGSQTWRAKHTTKHSKPRSRSRDTSSDNQTEKQEGGGKVSRARLGLRDWKDVLGAAALAGFSQLALDRAARRCAELFGQSMELRTLAEGEGKDSLVRYEPGMAPAVPAESDEESADDGHERLPQIKRQVRSAIVTSDDSRGWSSSAPRSRPRSRSRSALVAGSYFCHADGCPRAMDGFSRRTNLTRHMKLVHNLDNDEVPTDVDSEDEVDGAVHVDGFLKPIRIRRGWRGDDLRPRPGRKRTGGRHRKRDRDSNADEVGGLGDEDIVMGDESK